MPIFNIFLRLEIFMLNNIFNAYQEFCIKSTDFRRTTSRSNWLWVQLAIFIISFLNIPIFFRKFDFNIYGIIWTLPPKAIDIPRLRDFGKHWKWIFIKCIPILGWIVWFFWLGFGALAEESQNLWINLENLGPSDNELSFLC